MSASNPLDEAIDIKRDAEDGLRTGLLVLRAQMRLGEGLGASDVRVVVGECSSDKHRPVVIAALGELAACRRAEQDDRHVRRYLAGRKRGPLGIERLCRKSGGRGQVFEPNTCRFLELLQRAARIVYKRGGASRIHGTSRHLSSTGSKSSSSSTVIET